MQRNTRADARVRARTHTHASAATNSMHASITVSGMCTDVYVK